MEKLDIRRMKKSLIPFNQRHHNRFIRQIRVSVRYGMGKMQGAMHNIFSGQKIEAKGIFQ